MRVVLLATYLLMIALAGPALAQASDSIAPPPDPPGVWRKLTHDPATTTSTCIGNPVTPLCAAETFWACFLRLQPELCDMVEARVRPHLNVSKPLNHRLEYRVAYARRPSPLDPVDRATEGNMKPLAGDVLIALIRRSCWGPLDDESDCATGQETAPPYIHLLRRQGEFWVYVYRYRAPY